jgi:hypothetical protein
MPKISKSKKSKFSSPMDRKRVKFLQSTLSFSLIMLAGFTASFFFTQQKQIASAFIPPQPLSSSNQISKVGCVDDSGDGDFSENEGVNCVFGLSSSSIDLDINDHKYYAVAATGQEKTAKDLGTAQECNYLDRSLTCLDIDTSVVSADKQYNLYIAVRNLDTDKISLVQVPLINLISQI